MPTSVQVVSDSEIRVHNPALVAGQYPVTVSSGGQTLPGSVKLVVVDPPHFPYAVIPLNSSNLNGLADGRLIYDAERQAIYILDNSEFSPMQDSIGRFRHVNDTWVTDPTIDIPIPSPVNVPIGAPTFDTFSAMVLTPDGRRLVKSNEQTISVIDLAAWQIVSTTDASSPLGSDVTLLTGAMGNDGGFIEAASSSNGTSQAVYEVLRFDPVAGTFSVIATPSDLTTNWTLAAPVASPDPEGRQITFYSGSTLPATLLTYVVGGSTLGDSIPGDNQNITAVRYSRDGRRVLFQHHGAAGAAVLSIRSSGAADQSYQLGVMGAGVLSSDGMRAYLWDPSAGTTGLLHTLDLSMIATTGTFSELGPPVQIPDSPGTGPIMVITPDGGNLILAGTTNLIVIPTPSP